MRACAHAGVRGFNVSRKRSSNMGTVTPQDKDLKGTVFYYDEIHPGAWYGQCS